MFVSGSDWSERGEMEWLSSSAVAKGATAKRPSSSAFHKERATAMCQHVKIDIKNTLISNDLFVYSLICQYESSPV